MSVNKPTNIVPPKDGEEKPKKASLFERASGAFGLDRLAPASVPEKLADDKAKKFAPKRKSKPAPAPAAETPKRRASDWIGQPATADAAAPASAPAAPAEPQSPAVVFNGPKQAVPRSRLHEKGLIDPDGGASTLLEEFRIVKRQVL